MNKEYNKSNIEIKAKELLLPIRGMCPDSVWQELNYHLNEHTSVQSQWTGKLNSTSKIIIGAVAVVSVIGLLIWKFSGKIENWSHDKSTGTTLFKNAQPAPSPVKKELPPPTKAVATSDTTHVVKPVVVKDSAKVPKNNIPVASNVVATQNVAPVQLTAAQKNWRDSVVAVRRNAAILGRHRRDSVVLARKGNQNGSKRAIPHDSLTSKGDTNW
jgi:hypothetical protein